ncbi:MAG: hypothetical protein ACYC99_01270 [Candidatus Geothermincolia bacterium]
MTNNNAKKNSRQDCRQGICALLSILICCLLFSGCSPPNQAKQTNLRVAFKLGTIETSLGQCSDNFVAIAEEYTRTKVLSPRGKENLLYSFRISEGVFEATGVKPLEDIPDERLMSAKHLLREAQLLNLNLWFFVHRMEEGIDPGTEDLPKGVVKKTDSDGKVRFFYAEKEIDSMQVVLLFRDQTVVLLDTAKSLLMEWFAEQPPPTKQTPGMKD